MDQKKSDLLRNLREDTYTQIRPSKIHGVGVFAIKDIPEGVDPFVWTGNQVNSRTVILDEKEVANLPKPIRDHFKRFVFMTGNEKYYEVPAAGLNSLDVSWYLNHSDLPNLSFHWKNKKDPYMRFQTIRKVLKDEELTYNYEANGSS